jgi:Transposase and inactivated derivatives
MDLLKQIVKWLEDKKIFSRKRKSNEMRALGMLLYYAGLSYEKAGMFAGASYEAVREWYQKGKELFEESIEKKRRKWIAVDEKEIKINGVTVFIWGAVDIDDEKVLAVWVPFGRSGLEAKAFLKKVRDTCKGRLPRIFIDGGSWYYWALRVVCFKRYTVVSFGPRSAIERLFSDIERRIREVPSFLVSVSTKINHTNPSSLLACLHSLKKQHRKNSRVFPFIFS